MLGSVFGRTDFPWICGFGPPDFFADFIAPPMPTGAYRQPRPLPAIDLIVERRGGRSWRRVVAQGTTWRAVRTMMSRDLQRPQETIDISIGGLPADLDADVPPGEGYPVRALWYGVRERQDRSRSREHQQAAPEDRPPPLRDPVPQNGNVDVEVIDFELVTPIGTWYLPVPLTAFPHVATWGRLSIDEVSTYLGDTYDFLWGGGRPGIARRRQMQPGHRLLEDLMSPMTSFQVAPPNQLGGKAEKRKQKGLTIDLTSPPPKRSAKTAEKKPDMQFLEPQFCGNLLNMTCTVPEGPLIDRRGMAHFKVWDDDISPRRLVISGVPHIVTTASMAEKIAKQIPGLSARDHRFTFVTPEGKIVKDGVGMDSNRLPKLLVLVSGTQGKGKEEIEDLVKLVKQSVNEKLRVNQVKLLLRGDEVLANKIAKHQSDPQRVKQLVLEGAARYGMGSSKPQPAAPNQSVDQEWKTVGPKPKAKGPAKPQISPSTRRYKLMEQEWNYPVHSSFTLGAEGVFFEHELQEALQHDRVLQGTRQAAALISTQPLPGALSASRETFTIVEAADETRSRVVQGFLNNYHVNKVLFKGSVVTVERTLPGAGAATSLIKLHYPKTAVKDSTWSKVVKLAKSVDINKMLKQDFPAVKIQDAFRLEKTATAISFMVRVTRDHVPTLLKDPEVDALMTPIGPAGDDYKILWDREVTTVASIWAKYSQLKGYMGAGGSQTAMGARFTAGTAENAKKEAGLPTGDPFVVTGIPTDLPAGEVEPLLRDCGWVAKLVDHSRRVRGPLCSYRVRAQGPPPHQVMRIVSGKEVITLRIQESVAKKTEKTKEDQGPCSTWAEAAKRALGRAPLEHKAPVHHVDPEDDADMEDDHLWPGYQDYWEEEQLPDDDTQDHWDDTPRPEPTPKRVKLPPHDHDRRMGRLEEQMGQMQIQLQTLVSSLIPPC